MHMPRLHLCHVQYFGSDRCQNLDEWQKNINEDKTEFPLNFNHRITIIISGKKRKKKPMKLGPVLNDACNDK